MNARLWLIPAVAVMLAPVARRPATRRRAERRHVHERHRADPAAQLSACHNPDGGAPMSLITYEECAPGRAR